jgi:hypothetical protein
MKRDPVKIAAKLASSSPTHWPRSSNKTASKSSSSR